MDHGLLESLMISLFSQFPTTLGNPFSCASIRMHVLLCPIVGCGVVSSPQARHCVSLWSTPDFLRPNRPQRLVVATISYQRCGMGVAFERLTQFVTSVRSQTSVELLVLGDQALFVTVIHYSSGICRSSQ